MLKQYEAKPALGFSAWLEAIERKLGYEIGGTNYARATALYEQCVPWPEALEALFPEETE